MAAGVNGAGFTAWVSARERSQGWDEGDGEQG